MKKIMSTLLLVISLSSHANLLIVDSNEDVIQVDNNCTLREAITAANFDITVDQCGTGLGDDLIWVLFGTSGDAIQLNSILGIIDGVEIQGPGADNLVLVPANGHDEHIFQINTDRDVTLKGFRIGGAQSSAIEVVNVDDLVIEDMRFLNNTAGGSGTYGGAIHADLFEDTLSINSLTIDNTEFTANSAGIGGALAISGIYTVTINNTVFQSNSSTGSGGAITRLNNSHLIEDIIDSKLIINNGQFNANVSNTNGGAIAIEFAFLEINESLFYQNDGNNVIDISRNLSYINNSLFAENTTDKVIRHRTFNNSNEETELTLAFNTFLDNQNLDIENITTGAPLTTYLLANVFDGDDSFHCQGTGNVSLGDNFQRSGSDCAQGINDFPGTDPELLPLDTYGGDVLIAPPSPVSPLVDAGSGCDTNDLSGEGRSRDGDADGNDDCDIGAVERPDAHLLTVDVTGNGNGQVDLSGFYIVCYTSETCGWPLEQGATFTLEPVADTGSQFVQWGGACSGTGNCTVTMDSAKSVTAEFALVSNPVNLTVETYKTENYLSATVHSNPIGISCEPFCSFDFQENETVVLTANLAPDTIVDSWDNCHEVSMDGLSCTIHLGSMDEVVDIYLDKHPDIIFKNTFESP